MKTKTHVIRVVVPAKGERPRHEYHSDLVYMMGLRREPEDDFRPAHEADAEIRDVPANLSPEDVRTACQGLIDLGGGFPNPSVWDSDIVEPLKRKGYVLEPGRKLKEAKA